MTVKSLCAALAPALMLAACGNPASPDPTPTAAPVAGGGVEDGAMAPTPDPVAGNSVVGSQDVPPDLSPPELTPEAERGETGARNVLLSFARAIEFKQFDQARALLSPADQRKWSRAAFARHFADLGKLTVAVPDGMIEGAAGSSYYTAPIAITGSDRSGRPVRIEGKAVLKRVNDVDGATPAQLRWHFDRLTLDWMH